jgi:hypothetical protein
VLLGRRKLGPINQINLAQIPCQIQRCSSDRRYVSKIEKGTFISKIEALLLSLRGEIRG